MAIPAQRRKPAYALNSVDNALRLLQMLRDRGELRGKEAAAELGLSPSTVHRLMSMLVFRGFAAQDESRSYRPGPSIGVGAVSARYTKHLIHCARPHLERLRDEIEESSYLIALFGTSIRFLMSAEADYPTHAGDRDGFVLPAHSSAGGRAILANKSPNDVVDVFLSGGGPQLSLPELERLQAELRGVRTRGYALSVEEAELGIASIAVPIRIENLQPAAAVSIAGPVSRLRKLSDPAMLARLGRTRALIEAEMRVRSDAGEFTPMAVEPSDTLSHEV
ncbi:IclR family transcriptional regulator [Leifsonia sp. Root112D2]|uniref:IclR family transcriptional regulator n=1 Tax=Leifsonia sp. Root112D2 TaxID=1736426 RepID=UPI0006FEE6B2|nr:IclR family transcriptional regulator [Leifsonia sp. Root112D2]KQV06438.1 hypothetical protein ASC63_03055 [Leifsonia sp. Root112D2]